MPGERHVAHDVGQHRALDLAHVDGRAGLARHRRDRADVVEVGVGEEDRLDLRPSSSTGARMRSASSPGSKITARSEPSRRAMKQFSCTGPTVNMRTSIGR